MQTDNEKYNETVQPNTAFLNELKAKLPEFFSNDGSFDLEKFKNQLKENNVDELNDGYQLNFIGKDYARRQAGEIPKTVIVPDESQNTGEGKNSDNLFFTGDNLEVLRHLQNNYQNKIDVIYIDPPYNTGQDGFVYPDSFEYSDDQLKDMFDINDEQVDHLKSIQGKSSHSAWLTFMYPRLALSKKLLSNNGIIFISIDDNEYDNLNELMKLIYGEANQVGPMIQNKANSKNDSNAVQKNHDYVLCYTKTIDPNIKVKKIKKTEVFTDDGHNFYLLKDPITTRGDGGVLRNRINLGYTIYYNPQSGDVQTVMDYNKEFNFKANTQEHEVYHTTDLVNKGYIPIRPPKVRGELGAWTWQMSKFNNNKDRIKIVKTRNGYSVRKIQKVDNNKVKRDSDGHYYTNAITLTNARSIMKFSTSQGTARINQLFDEQGLFNNPKNDQLIKYLVNLVLDDDVTVLDFFAGSSTTADAVMQLNAEDGGNRKFIMVQLPEKTYKVDKKTGKAKLDKSGNKIPTKGGKAAYEAGYMSIDQISRERIRRAADEIRKNNKLTLPKDFDGSFKHYRVIKPIKETLKQIKDFNPNALNLFSDMVESFSSNRLNVSGNASGEQTILATWLARDGFSFDLDVQNVQFGNYRANLANDRLYLINEGWGKEQTKQLLNELGQNQLHIQSIVIFGYSFDYDALHTLEIGLDQLNTKVELFKRY